MSLLSHAGLTANPITQNYSKDVIRDYGRRAMREIMSADCHGLVDFSMNKDHAVIGGNEGCIELKKSVKIDKIGVFSITRDGLRAYEYAYGQCQKNKPVELGIYHSRKKINVNCNKIPERPVIYQIRLKE